MSSGNLLRLLERPNGCFEQKSEPSGSRHVSAGSGEKMRSAVLNTPSQWLTMDMAESCTLFDSVGIINVTLHNRKTMERRR